MAYYLPRLYVSVYVGYRKQEGPAFLPLYVSILITLKFHSKYILIQVWNIFKETQGIAIYCSMHNGKCSATNFASCHSNVLVVRQQLCDWCTLLHVPAQVVCRRQTIT